MDFNEKFLALMIREPCKTNESDETIWSVAFLDEKQKLNKYQPVVIR